MAAATVLAACSSASAHLTTWPGHADGRSAAARTSQTGPASAGAPDPVTTFRAAGCRVEVQQAMDGAVSGCVRVGDVAAGPEHVTLRQGLLARQAPAVEGSSGATAAGPAVTLRLQPASGPPGTTVTIIGTLAGPPTPQPSYANACWDGCRDGVQYSGVALTWTSATTFRTTMVIPDAPWIEAGPDRVVRPTDGTDRIGIECLASIAGCALGAAEGSAAFRLQGAPSIPWCVRAAACARLTASPTRVLPGDVVTVTGDAPIVSVIGSDQPFVFELHVASGVGTGPTVSVARSAKTAAALMDFGRATFTVGVPPALAALGSAPPAAIQVDGLAPIAAEPGDPSVVAWCGRGHVTVDGPGGRRAVPIAAAATTLTRLGYGLMTASLPLCAAVVPLADPADGPPSVAAAFTVAPGDQAPPVADVALVTTDGGAGWQTVPVPGGAQRDGFAGFVTRGTTLEARFAPVAGAGSPALVAGAGSAAPAGSPGTASAPPAGSGGPSSSATVPLVEQTSDAGASWQAVPFASCSAAGPCVRFGAYRPGNCAMNGTTQPLARRAGGDGHWVVPGWPADVEACMPATLASVGGHTELLVASGSHYLVRDSTDGGATWQVLGMPPVPGVTPGDGFTPGGGGLVLLPDGALLAWENGSSPTPIAWHLLPAGGNAWCDASRSFPAGAGVRVSSWPVVLGDQLWWQTSGGGSPATAVASTITDHVAVTAIRC